MGSALICVKCQTDRGNCTCGCPYCCQCADCRATEPMGECRWETAAYKLP